MSLGRGPSCESWLAFCPRENLEDLDVANAAPLLSEKQHGDTRLSAPHFRMAIMFLAYALSKNTSLPIYVMHPYGTDDDLSAWKSGTCQHIVSQFFCASIFPLIDSQVTWDLRLTDLVNLHQTIIEEWDDWVDAAPRSWKQDGWLLTRAPAAVACRYGQNQPIASSDPQAHTLEARNWHAERAYPYIRYISVAIATDITCIRVKRWIEVPNDEIIQVHGVVYDSPDPAIRER
ncbi:uncharacterized protein EDB93DRAFT_1255001 [Suillus bovinus]|uniref:uncharacterized protein n=1 Tax=Suillus bovinus TaxID=48563 RepID=UPI001B862A31|nr:uncharacterized protein EDB93DRAFT_1255001 [Suillus bovinus]KAG2133226.1 hypothetical protein EDB93DRAFT_1255001 [Suillus bovinus]